MHKSMDRTKSPATAKSAARRRHSNVQPRHEGFSVLYASAGRDWPIRGINQTELRVIIGSSAAACMGPKSNSRSAPGAPQHKLIWQTCPKSASTLPSRTRKGFSHGLGRFATDGDREFSSPNDAARLIMRHAGKLSLLDQPVSPFRCI